MKFRRPIDNHHYGYDFLDIEAQKGRYHPGEDMNGPGAGNADKGMPVYPIGPGVVSFVDTDGPNSGWGNIMYVKHDMKTYFESKGLPLPSWCPEFVWSQYAHMLSIDVKLGDSVDPSKPVGKLGGTPYWSAHLHHEVRKMPLGVYFYPKAGTTKKWMTDHYFKPRDFVAMVNKYVEEGEQEKRPSVGLIQYDGQPAVWIFNGKTRHWIPDEETAILLFGPDWAEGIQLVSKNMMGTIPTGDQLPSLKA